MFLKLVVEKFFFKALYQFSNGDRNSEFLKNYALRIELAREETFGDYAVLSAMDKTLRNALQIYNPKELAKKWIQNVHFTNLEIEEIPLDQDLLSFIFKQKKTLSSEDVFESIQYADPGFINVFLNKNILFFFLLLSITKNDQYGRSRIQNPRNIIFEFVSANPTGPLNIVSARAAALGDSCCNLLQAIGESVYREYYVNDYGNQIDLLGISLLLRFLEKKQIPLKFSFKENGKIIYPKQIGIPFPSEAYHGNYIIEVLEFILNKKTIEISDKKLNDIKVFSLNTNLKEEDLELILDEDLKKISEDLAKQAVDYFLNLHREDLSQFRVQFDNFFKESSLHQNNKVKDVISKIQPYVYTKDNKLYFRSTEFGDSEDRVLVRDNGKPTYFLADIAYHNSKIERNFNTIINIWGPDHHGYIQRLKGAVESLGFPKENFQILIAQQVTLLEDGKPITMSKRTGKIIQMKELLEEIPIDVARYFFILRSFDAHLEFDLNQAKDTSDKNPYYYVAYAHARIHSIFKKYFLEKSISSIEEFFTKFDFEFFLKISQEFEITCKDRNLETYNFRRSLLLDIARFTEEIYESAIHFQPHRLANFLYKLANDFAKFYSLKQNKIIGIEQKEAIFLLYILYAVKICLSNGLRLLGANAPEQL